ncbi:MAG: CHAT domain-containing protein, partial [Paramuribaculum sp.]|nr:CHAT domain-containing protein [Paramuribaculum sp.]
PTERLNSVALEYAATPSGRVCDNWNIERLSSTRELLKSRRVPHTTNAILYGGLDYDLGKNELIAESHQGTCHNTHASRSGALGINRYGVEFLPGTIAEVNEIAKRFEKKTIQYRTITGKEGTEESFKSIMGQYVDILHLATHGFFWSPEVAEKRNYVSFLQRKEINSNEEDAMLRSGLLFTGANVALMGEELPEDVEDGVLTAKELSNMNLWNVDLVVMSACESGLGETSGEGVFGLQRGFKLAGANTLLMSLWKVDDEATKILMTEFYRYYLSGKTKQESLHLAQLTLRNNPEFADPKYWAAFILLDALN